MNKSCPLAENSGFSTQIFAAPDGMSKPKYREIGARGVLAAAVDSRQSRRPRHDLWAGREQSFARHSIRQIRGFPPAKQASEIDRLSALGRQVGHSSPASGGGKVIDAKGCRRGSGRSRRHHPRHRVQRRSLYALAVIIMRTSLSAVSALKNPASYWRTRNLVRAGRMLVAGMGRALSWFEV